MKNRKQKNLSQSGKMNDLPKARPIKIIAVTAGKGGVGKSNVAVNLAIALAQKKRKVLLLDADLGLANIDILMGLHGKYNLSHVIKGSCRLADIILDGPGGIKVIPSSSGTEYMTKLSLAEHAGIIESFSELSDDLDYMIIDTAAGISETVLSFLRSTQEMVVLICDEPTSLTDSYALMKVMNQRFERFHFHVLVNMTHSTHEGRDLFNKLCRVADQFLDISLNYLGAIPFDESVHEAVKQQKPFMLAFPNAKATRAILQLADTIEEWPIKPSIGGNTSFFIERLLSRH